MPDTVDVSRVFSLTDSKVPNKLVRFAERLLGFDTLNLLHRSIAGETPRDAISRALDGLGVKVELDARSAARLPASGATLVVANLPNGSLDGLVLASQLLALRSDVKLLIAKRERPLPLVEGVVLELAEKGSDPHGNARVLRAAIRHLENGGMLAHFPARTSATTPDHPASHDGPWSTLIATLARRAKAHVLPVYLSKAEPHYFSRWLGRASVTRALEPTALLSRRGRAITLRVGHTIEATSFDRFARDRELTDYFRLRTSLLGRATVSRPALLPSPESKPLAAPMDPEVLALEVTALGERSVLASAGDLDVILARADAIPSVMLEIGRLREQTFRAVGEGTGSPRDLDLFDRDYLQLFIWDRSAQRVVGGYRLGLVDELLRKRGVSGLYTHTLFDYDTRFLSGIGNAVELGRSFIVADYQRSYAPLDLLWRGIGAFLAGNPRYTALFGPVSISAAYCGVARELIVEHIQHHQFDGKLAALVAARTPLRSSEARQNGIHWTKSMVADTAEVSRMVTDLERDEKGIPVLVREYLKLGGQFVGFNLDATFADCLDGLVVVALDRMPDKYRRRYLRNSAG